MEYENAPLTSMTVDAGTVKFPVNTCANQAITKLIHESSFPHATIPLPSSQCVDCLFGQMAERCLESTSFHHKLERIRTRALSYQSNPHETHTCSSSEKLDTLFSFIQARICGVAQSPTITSSPPTRSKCENQSPATN